MWWPGSPCRVGGAHLSPVHASLSTLQHKTTTDRQSAGVLSDLNDSGLKHWDRLMTQAGQNLLSHSTAMSVEPCVETVKF